MIDITDRDTGTLITQITEEQLALLIRELEEESSDDQDYYIDMGTLSLLGAAGMDKAFLHTLGAALGEREGMEIVWRRRE
ncbi:MAG: hypothetical protein KDI60_19615 [Xanthomonadales bacterium]|nr:hypothetical protein [Xanthomonadales bacterium]MCP5477114.1 galactosyldiacylglycerol synthase [Rhodanobacteraceae bacterium]